MKKIYTIASLLFLFCSLHAQSFSDDFEAYTTGYLGPQSPDWTTWSGTEGGTEDATVVSSISHSGSKSVYFHSTSTSGGPTDCILPFGGPYNTGSFSYGMWMYVNSGEGAYFNLQAENTPGTTWVFDCYFMENGDLIIQNNAGDLLLRSTYTQASWFEFEIQANLNINDWDVLMNGVLIGTFQNNVYQVASVDIFPVNPVSGNATFWVDDVSYDHVTYTLPSLNAGVSMLDVNGGLAGQEKTATVTIRNLGITTITSLDLDFTYGAGTSLSQNLTGLSIPSLATYTHTFTTPFTLLAGANSATATVSNVNGNPSDHDSTDDSKTIILDPIVPASGKLVIGEEGTGTWCGWCPRGAVMMDEMKSKYDGYFQGIAVHNSDVMTLVPYDSAIDIYLSGYPGAMVDRGTVMDPTGMEADFLQRIQVAPKALLTNKAVYNATTRQLDVTVSTEIKQPTSGPYKISCVIIEDSVHNSASTYNQANYYAGGGSGEMGGFELLPNPVPANKMSYEHVARAISPSYWGSTGSFNSSMSIGEIYENSFSFILDPSWVYDKMKIVSLFIDPSGQIDNAGSTTIDEARANMGTGFNLVTRPYWSILPNPASEFSAVYLELPSATEIQLSILNANGQIMANRSYGMLTGNQMLPINTSFLASGIYTIQVQFDSQILDSKTLIKQ